MGDSQEYELHWVRDELYEALMLIHVLKRLQTPVSDKGTRVVINVIDSKIEHSFSELNDYLEAEADIKTESDSEPLK